jgi:uncharacterized membrane protein
MNVSLNIHPIFVHFPIALLTIYSVLELIRFRRLLDSSEWFHVKFGLVVLGVLLGLVTAYTGDMAKHLIPGGRTSPLISTHELWAETTLVIFSFAAAGYLVAFIKKFRIPFLYKRNFIGKVWKFLLRAEYLILETPLIIFIALVGLVSVFITGALGGSIVYGPSSDPFAYFVYHLFFP